MKREEAEKVLNCAHKYKFYIPSDVFENAIQIQRKIVVQLPDADGVKIKWKARQMQEVKKGDCIAEIYRKSGGYGTFSVQGKEMKNQEIRTPWVGVIFQFKVNAISYGVISIKTDNKDSIKAWIKAGGK